MGTFLHGLPQHLQLLDMWGYASVCDGWTSLVVSLLCQGDFKPLCSSLGWQKETFLSLVNHNLSLLSWCKPDLQSVDLDHWVTFDVNTSFTEVTKAYNSYLKNKKEKISLTSKGGQASRYVEQFYQVWDVYFWMTPKKGQLITPTAVCWEQKEQRVGFGDHSLDPKELKYIGYLSPQKCKRTIEVAYHPSQSIHWPGSDWACNPGIHWMAPKEIQWLCGPTFWPWLPIGWVDCCTRVYFCLW